MNRLFSRKATVPITIVPARSAFVNAGDGEAIALSVSRDSSGKFGGVTGHLNTEIG